MRPYTRVEMHKRFQLKKVGKDMSLHRWEVLDCGDGSCAYDGSGTDPGSSADLRRVASYEPVYFKGTENVDKREFGDTAGKYAAEGVAYELAEMCKDFLNAKEGHEKVLKWKRRKDACPHEFFDWVQVGDIEDIKHRTCRLCGQRQLRLYPVKWQLTER